MALVRDTADPCAMLVFKISPTLPAAAAVLAVVPITPDVLENVKDVALAAPSTGVTNVGDVASTIVPLPMVPLLKLLAASWPTVSAPPDNVCCTTCDAPPVPLKSVVPAGKVIVLVPAIAAAFSFIEPLVDPFREKSLTLNDCPADHVLIVFKSGIVAPLVPIAVEQPVAPFERSAQASV